MKDMDFLMQTTKQQHLEILSEVSNLQSIVRSTSLIMYKSLLGLKTELNKY